MDTPSEVSTAQPPTPPTKIRAPNTDIDMADNPENISWNIHLCKSEIKYFFDILIK